MIDLNNKVRFLGDLSDVYTVIDQAERMVNKNEYIYSKIVSATDKTSAPKWVYTDELEKVSSNA